MGEEVLSLSHYQRITTSEIQKSKRSRPIICHVDKLKKWTTDEPPKSWLTSNKQQPDDDSDPNFDTNPVDNTQPDQTTEKVTTTNEDIDSTPVKQIVESAFEPSFEGPPDAAIAGDPSSVQQKRQRSQREIRRPIRYQD